MKISETGHKNSFFRFGGMEILSMEQDAYSFLWKIKLAADKHYVVSKEFDRTKGLYANAPDDVVRTGLMEFSNSLVGSEMSIYDVMTAFIERCFDDSAFGKYTANAAWMCMDFPHYDEIEDMLANFDTRIIWDYGPSKYMDALNSLIGRYLKPEDERKYIGNLIESFEERKIGAIFMNNDQKCERIIRENGEFENVCLFKASYDNAGNFKCFQFTKH